MQSFQQMGDLAPLTRDNIISLVDECHRSPEGRGHRELRDDDAREAAKGFRFGFTGTPIDRTMQNTHRDFGPLKDGVQERYLSYYGIRRAIQDGATLEVHYIRDQVPFKVDERPLSVGFEQMCEEMELEDEEAKDFVQRQTSQWKETARATPSASTSCSKDADAFPRASRSRTVSRRSSSRSTGRRAPLYKDALDDKLKARGLPPEWSDVIISEAQNSEPEIERVRVPESRSRTS